MIRLFFVRLFVCFFVVVGVVVVSGCIAGYLALQQPAFYADLRAQPVSKGDLTSAQESFRIVSMDLRQWCDRSIGLQRAQLSGSALVTESVSGYDPTQDTHSITVTEKQINGQFAAGESGMSRELKNPRIRITPDCIDLGCEIATTRINCVLLVEFKPTIASDGRLRVDLLAARIGKLPLPLRILGWLPRGIFHVGKGEELNLAAPTPYICITLLDNSAKSPAVKSIRCTEGAMTLEFLAPVLKPREKSGDVATDLVGHH